MAELRKIGVVVDTRVEIILTEDELGALDAMFGYSIDSFLEIFYKHLGAAYMKPHEAGLRSLAATVRGCAGLTGEARECREFLRDAAKRRVAAMNREGR